MNIIDLLGILPYFMSLFLDLVTVSGKTSFAFPGNILLENINYSDGNLGRYRDFWQVWDEEDRSDIPYYENPEDIQTGPAHHGAPDSRDDPQEQVREKPSVFLANWAELLRILYFMFKIKNPQQTYKNYLALS